MFKDRLNLWLHFFVVLFPDYVWVDQWIWGVASPILCSGGIQHVLLEPSQWQGNQGTGSDPQTDPQTESVTQFYQFEFSVFVFSPPRKQRAAFLSPAPPGSLSGLSRGTRVPDLSPSSLWAPTHSSSKTAARMSCPSKIAYRLESSCKRANMSF